MDETGQLKKTETQQSYSKLAANLEEMTKQYRSLLEILRKEKEHLLASDLEKIKECNQSKEASIYKIRAMDMARERYSKELALAIGADAASPRLLELARHMGGEDADRLRQIHSSLELLVRRVQEVNRENEIYAQSALETLSGALGEIKETLTPKKVYGRNGKMASANDSSGALSQKKG